MDLTDIELEHWVLSSFLNNQFDRVNQVLIHKINLTPKTRLVYAVCLRRMNLLQESLNQYIYLHEHKTEFEQLSASNQIDVYDGLAASYHSVGNITLTLQYGRLALAQRSQVYKYAPINWVLSENKKLHVQHAKKLANGKKVISYSLYGNLAVYTETLLMSLAIAKALYPDWQVWVYHDETVTKRNLNRLVQAGAHLKQLTQQQKNYPGTMWRFLAVEDQTVEWVLFRDADSLLSQRERNCVNHWMNSHASVHAIRDWYSHTEVLMAGMIGVYAPRFRGMTQAIEHFLSLPYTPSHGDQHFLRAYLWPYAQGDVCVHDSCYGTQHERAVFAEPPTLLNHIGSCLSREIYIDKPVSATCNFEQVNAQFYLGERLFCEYPLLNKAVHPKPGWVIELPLAMCEAMLAGQIQLKLQDKTAA